MDSATSTLAPSPGAPTPTLNLENVLYETKGAIAYVTVNRRIKARSQGERHE